MNSSASRRRVECAGAGPEHTIKSPVLPRTVHRYHVTKLTTRRAAAGDPPARFCPLFLVNKLLAAVTTTGYPVTRTRWSGVWQLAGEHLANVRAQLIPLLSNDSLDNRGIVTATRVCFVLSPDTDALGQI